MPSLAMYESDKHDFASYEWIRGHKLSLKTDDDGENVLFTNSLGPNDF